ncbi:MAG: hypothetical protein ACRDQC_15725 [Gaiellales bacterium]
MQTLSTASHGSVAFIQELKVLDGLRVLAELLLDVGESEDVSGVMALIGARCSERCPVPGLPQRPHRGGLVARPPVPALFELGQ